MPAGRPSKFKEEYVKLARELCESGAIIRDLADAFGVANSTIHQWRLKHPRFADAIKDGKHVADDRVEESLFTRAVGYRQDAVRIFLPKGSREPVFAEYIEEVQPDVTAQIFWLKNRRPDRWRDKQVVEHEMDADLAARLDRARARRTEADA